MKITKYEHACLVVEEQGSQLIIDPGVLSDSFMVPDNPVAVVITHVHGDHFDKNKVDQILAKNIQTKIFTVADVAKDIPGAILITDGQTEEVGPFKLRFIGEDHAITHPDAPRFKNTGVFVNETLYYPGDSFTLPGEDVKILAVPTSGPWLKTGESIDFMLNIKPQIAFCTHDSLLSEDGSSFTNNWLSNFASQNGIEYKVLKPGESISV